MQAAIITLWQPWASLIALGLKQYETRSWGTNYRGKLVIHAAKRPFVNADGSKTIDSAANIAWLDALRLGYEQGILTDKSKVPLAHELPLGRIVAIADLTNCVRMIPSDRYAAPGEIRIGRVSELEKAVGDWQPNRYAWKLENVVQTNPVIYTGGQGLRSFPLEKLESLVEGAA